MISRTRKLLLTACLAGAAMSAGGCATTAQSTKNAVNAYYLGDYPTAANILQADTVKKDENFVLNNCRYGSAVLAAGNAKEAENAFLSAYEVINGVKTNDGGRTMGAVMVFEGVKVWKGEPFERAMAHYYLGLVYMMKNDYENARAAFQNSLFNLRAYDKDSKGAPDPAKAQQIDTNFSLGYFGLGMCYLREGKTELADKNFEKAGKLQPSLLPVIAEINKPTTNALIFVDYGQGPRRAGKGWYNEESAFGPTPAEAGPIPVANLMIDGQPVPAMQTAMLDTLAMAQDQKWQDIDTIRKVKAAIGTGAMAAGSGMAAYGANRGDSRMMLAGLGVALAGAAIAASSQADLRYWEMLPRTVYVIPATIAPGEHQLQVQAGASVTVPFSATIRPGTEGDSVFYVRLR